MKGPETRMGGSREAFPETVWLTQLSGDGPVTEERRAALDRFVLRYWRPVYKYIRTAEGASVEDAKDLTQGFFHYLIEKGVLSRYDAAQGRLRQFLKGVLGNFLSEVRRWEARQKRGGDLQVLSLDVSKIETEGFARERDRCGPDEVFDRQWAEDLLSRALAAVRQGLENEGKNRFWGVYQAYVLAPGPGPSPTYRDVARDLSLTPLQVQNSLQYVRSRLKEAILAEIRGSAGPAQGGDPEMIRLLQP